MEAQIVADGIEGGLGLTQTTRQVNDHRKQCDPPLIEVGRSAVHSGSLRLMPLMTPILDAKQGSFDENSAWAIARTNFVLQLLVRFGVMTGPAAWAFVHGEGDVPAYFTLSLVGTLELPQISWWDESHKKPQIGGKGHDAKGSRTQYRFKRDPEGKLNPDGEYAERQYQLKAKYLEESRLCLGCGMVIIDGVETGLRAQPFDYSGQWIITIKEKRAKVLGEIARVKELPGMGAPWVTGQRGDGELFLLDSVIHVKSVGPVKLNTLERSGIFTVAHLLASTAPHLAVLRASAAAANPQPGAFPADRVVDHKKAANPYESRYGAGWEEVILSTSFLAGFVCITKMITHIVVESAKLFLSTPHAHDWRWYHDALSQLTASDTVEWMKLEMFDGMSYYERWIKPMEGLNAGTEYEGRPVGNSPELMPWDASLNQDVDCSVARHVSACSLLQPTDPGYDKRFSRYTPKLQTSAYLRVLDPAHGPHGGSPSSSRICQDVSKFLVACCAIRDARGICVPGLGSRQGHRAAAAAPQPRGGKRTKNSPAEGEWLHADAVGPLALFRARAEKRHKSDKEEDAAEEGEVE